MNATRTGILASMMVLLGAAAGCADAQAPMGAKSEGYAPPEPVAVTPVPSAGPLAPPPSVTKGEAESSVDTGGRHESVARRNKGKEGPVLEEKPGLGTEWGETRRSEIEMVSFERADQKQPSATASLFYNDAEGARALRERASSPVSSEMFSVAHGLLKIGLRDESGRLFPGFVSGEREVVVGEAGHRYTILVHNNADRRVEVVVSVDGLDVLDGKTASFGKRGYVVGGHGDIEIDGFRQSLDAVAAFRFGSVRGSYAGEKYGDTRNVGVIGVAAFEEKGSLPFPWTPDEVRRRKAANPFPGEFATPVAD